MLAVAYAVSFCAVASRPAATARSRSRSARIASRPLTTTAAPSSATNAAAVASHHRCLAANFRARYPAVEVDPDVLYVDTGQILTSAGAAAGLDLCLHLTHLNPGASD